LIPPSDHLHIKTDISPNDKMFTGDREHYFGVGQSALRCINLSLQAAHQPLHGVRDILDFACGHGRVLRYLRAFFPGAEIVASDMDRDGADFCARVFGAHAVYAVEDPASIPLEPYLFDLIWVGSLFTHLDAPKWIAFLEFFRRCLRPGGALVFTTHGHTTYDWMMRGIVDYGLPEHRAPDVRAGYERQGFGYADYSESQSWGHSLSSPAWVVNQIVSVNGLRPVHFSERAWDNHQDVYACIRELEIA
jgi:SAM-dependent methyltransferase